MRRCVEIKISPSRHALVDLHRCAAGQVYFQPNYAIDDSIARDGFYLCGNQISGSPRHRRDNLTHWLIFTGFYQFFGQDSVRRAIDQHYHYVNMMPTMEKAKKGLGLAPLASDSLLACFAKDSHVTPAPAVPDAAPGDATDKPVTINRAVRKKFAAWTGLSGFFSGKKPEPASGRRSSRRSSTSSAEPGTPTMEGVDSLQGAAKPKPKPKSSKAKTAPKKPASPPKKAKAAPSPKPVTKPRQPSVTVRPVTKKMASDPSVVSTDLSAAARPRRVSV